MVARLKKWGDRFFPERQILVRTEGRVSYITLTRRAQMVAASLLLTGSAVLGTLTATYVHISKDSPEQQAAAAARQATEEWRQMVALLEAQLMSANTELEQAQSRVATIGSQYGTLSGAVGADEQQLKDIADERARLEAERDELEKRLNDAQSKATAKAGQAAQLAKTLEQNKSELHQTEAQRASFQARIRELEAQVQAANARAAESKASLEAAQKKLQQIGAEREKATTDRERLAAERDGLKKQLGDIEAKLTMAEPADGATTPAISGLTPSRLRSRAGTAFADLETLLASTGLNVEHLLGLASGTARGEGGPYIALGDVKNLSPEEQTARNEILKKLLKSIPLAAPLAQFRVESTFGPRIDPFNKRQGFHPGVDLAAPFLSPVYSTAPGVVTFAGVNGNYGKFVEINHGNGIVTHYAHLHRFVVVRGQKVSGHQQIGQLGSTGRSTGPHVHYEVVVDGDPLDPEKFMEAGKNVVQVSGK